MGQIEILIRENEVVIRQNLTDSDAPEDTVEIVVTKKQYAMFQAAVKAAGWPKPKVARTVPVGSMEGCDLFLAAYPRKEVPYAARKIWREQGLAKYANVILAHVEKMKRSADWNKDGGMYIPYPNTYLSQRRWEGDDDFDYLSNVK